MTNMREHVYMAVVVLMAALAVGIATRYQMEPWLVTGVSFVICMLFGYNTGKNMSKGSCCDLMPKEKKDDTA